MEKRLCSVCQEEINPLRIKALPTATTCVEHSTVAAKRGRILTLGEGDHTYNEIEILEEDVYRRVVALEFGTTLPNEEMPEIQDYEGTLVADSSKALKARTDKYVEDEEESKLLEDPDEVKDDEEE